MGYPWQYNGLNDTAKHIIQQRQENDKLLKESTTSIKASSSDSLKIKYEEKQRKEREKQKELIIENLTNYNKQAKMLMNIINEFLEGKNSKLREKIKVNLKSLKGELKIEYKRINAAEYYGNTVEEAFYKPAINESWAKISSFPYNRIPTFEMDNKVHDVAYYTGYYLEELKDCNVMELGK